MSFVFLWTRHRCATTATRTASYSWLLLYVSSSHVHVGGPCLTCLTCQCVNDSSSVLLMSLSHGDRQLIVHEASYEPDPSTYAADHRPTRVTVCSTRTPSYAPKHQQSRFLSGQRLTSDAKYTAYGREVRHQSGGRRAWSHPMLAPGVPDTATRPVTSIAAQAPRRSAETGEQQLQFLDVPNAGGGKLHEVWESETTDGRWESSRSLPLLPHLCQPRSSTKHLHCRQHLPVTKPPRDVALSQDNLQEDLLESVRQLQLFQLQKHDTLRPGSLETTHLGENTSSPGSKSMAQQCSSIPMFHPCGLHFLGEGSSAAGCLPSSLQNRATLGRSNAAVELGDTAVAVGLPDVRLRCQSDSHLDLVGSLGQPRTPTNGSAHGQSRSYTALPLSPTLRPRQAPPQTIQSRWKTAFPDTCGTSVKGEPRFLRSCGVPAGTQQCALPREYEATEVRKLHATPDPS